MAEKQTVITPKDKMAWFDEMVAGGQMRIASELHSARQSSDLPRLPRVRQVIYRDLAELQLDIMREALDNYESTLAGYKLLNKDLGMLTDSLRGLNASLGKTDD